eukprot:15473398-Alexandrium_andersonii.AAC.1
MVSVWGVVRGCMVWGVVRGCIVADCLATGCSLLPKRCAQASFAPVSCYPSFAWIPKASCTQESHSLNNS